MALKPLANPIKSPFKLPAADKAGTLLAANTKALSKLTAAGGVSPLKPPKPTALERVFGPLDAPGTGVRSLAHNLVGVGPKVDPVAEMGKALRGEPRIEGSHIVGDLGVTNKWGKFIGGIAVDVLLDPLTYVTGLSGKAKDLAKGKYIAQLVPDGVLTATRLEEFGVPLAEVASKYGDDFVRALQTGVAAGDLPLEFTRQLAKMARVKAAAELGTRGGIKFMGVPVVPAAQAEKAAYAVKDVLRAAPGADWFMQAFVAGVKDPNEVLRVSADLAKRQLSGAEHMASVMGEEAAQRIAKILPDEESQIVATKAIADAFGERQPELAAGISKITTIAERRTRAYHDLVAGVDVDDIADPTFADKINAALDQVEELWKRKQGLIDELADAQREQRGAATVARKLAPRRNLSAGLEVGAEGSILGPGPAGAVAREAVEAPGYAYDAQEKLVLGLQARMKEMKTALKQSENYVKGGGAYGFTGKRGLGAWKSWLEAKPGRESVKDELAMVKDLLEGQIAIGRLKPRGYEPTSFLAQAPARIKELATEIRSLSGELTRTRATLAKKAGPWSRWVKADEDLSLQVQRVSALRDELLDMPTAVRKALMEAKHGADPESILRGTEAAKAEFDKLLGMAQEAGLKRKALYGVDSTAFLPGMTKAGEEVDLTISPFAKGKLAASSEQAKTFLDPVYREAAVPRGEVVAAGRAGATRSELMAGIESLGREAGPSTEMRLPKLVGRYEENTLKNVALANYENTVRSLYGPNRADEAESLLTKTRAAFSDDPAMTGFLNVYRKALNTWKKAATIWNVPMFPARNKMSNAWLLQSEGIFNPQAWALAPFLLSGKGNIRIAGKTWTADEIVRLAREKRVVVGDFEMAELVGENVKQAKGLTKLGRYINQNLVEDSDRLAGFISALRKGMDPDSAAMVVDRALYSYDSAMLTEFEKALRMWVPFGVWARRNIPHMLDLFATKPGYITPLGHARQVGFDVTGADRSIEPEYMRQLGAIPLPIQDKSGNPLMLNPNIPAQDLNKLDLQLRDTFGSISPIIKMPLELAVFKKDVFLGKELKAGVRSRAPGALQRLEDMAGGNPAWESVKKFLGMAIYKDSTTGTEYLAMDERAAKGLRDLAPVFNSLNKIADDAPKTPYDRFAQGTGIRLILFDKARLTLNKLYNDRDALQQALNALEQQGIETTPSPSLKKLPMGDPPGTSRSDKAYSGPAVKRLGPPVPKKQTPQDRYRALPQLKHSGVPEGYSSWGIQTPYFGGFSAVPIPPYFLPSPPPANWYPAEEDARFILQEHAPWQLDYWNNEYPLGDPPGTSRTAPDYTGAGVPIGSLVPQLRIDRRFQSTNRSTVERTDLRRQQNLISRALARGHAYSPFALPFGTETSPEWVASASPEAIAWRWPGIDREVLAQMVGLPAPAPVLALDPRAPYPVTFGDQRGGSWYAVNGLRPGAGGGTAAGSPASPPSAPTPSYAAYSSPNTFSGGQVASDALSAPLAANAQPSAYDVFTLFVNDQPMPSYETVGTEPYVDWTTLMGDATDPRSYGAKGETGKATQPPDQTTKGVIPYAWWAVGQMNAETSRKGKGTVAVSSGWRSIDEQAKRYAGDPKRFSKPGESTHGIVVDGKPASPSLDLAGADITLAELRKLAPKYGMVFPSPKLEPWHISVTPEVWRKLMED